MSATEKWAGGGLIFAITLVMVLWFAPRVENQGEPNPIAFPPPAGGLTEDPLLVKERDFRPVSANMDHAVRADGRRVSRIYAGTVNYRDKRGAWQRCDTTIEPDSIGEWSHTVWRAPYRVRFRTDRPRYKFDANGEYVIWELDWPESPDSCRIDQNRITWHLGPSVEFRLLCTPTTVKAVVVMQDATAPSAFTFLYQTSCNTITHVGAALARQVTFAREDKVPFWIPKLHAQDSSPGEVPQILPLRLRLQVGSIQISLTPTRQHTYPIYLDPTTEIWGNADAGDAYGKPSTSSWTENDDEFYVYRDTNPRDRVYVNTFSIGDSIHTGADIDSVIYTIHTVSVGSGGIVVYIDAAQIESAPVVEGNTGTYEAASWTSAYDSSETISSPLTSYYLEATAGFQEWINDYAHSGTDTIAIALWNKDTGSTGAYIKCRENSDVPSSQRPHIDVYWKTAPPDAPTNFVMTPVSTDSMACSWTDNADDEDGFAVCDTNGTPVADSVGANVTADTIASLDPGTRYYWKVGAYKTGSVFAFSNRDTNDTWPNAPGEMTVTAISNTELAFIINQNSNGTATYYAIQDSESVGGTEMFVCVDGDTLRAADDGIQADSTWMWGTYTEWGGASGDTLEGLSAATLYNLRAAAKSGL